MKNRIIQTFSLACLALCGPPAHSQVLLTTVTNTAYTYTQNFNTLPTQAGTVATSNIWANNVTLTGWYCNISNTVAPSIYGTAGAATNILGGSGSASSGGFYSFGSNGVNALSDRAMGSIQANSFAASGAPSMAYGIRFTNDTGLALTNFQISYTGEQWRQNANAAVQSLLFAYRVDSSPITNTDVGSLATWNGVSALNFNTPLAGATALQLDGNAAANRTALSATLTGIVVLPGQEIFLRWLDVNDPNNDHSLAIDDLTIIFTNTVASASAPTITVNPASQTLREGTPLNASVSVGGTQPISFFWFTIETGVTNFVGTANPQLIYAYPGTSQSGNQYFVIASNVVGTATSAVATLTVTSSVPIPATIAFLRSLRHPTTYAVTDQTNLYQIDGIVTTPNVITGPLQSYFVQDGTGGMDVFNRDGAFSLPAVGDHVKITGPLFNFNGLLEMNITNANPSHKVVNLGAGMLPTPVLFNFASAGNPTLMEDSIEGTLVVVTNVFLGYTNSVFFIAGTSIPMTNTLGKRFDISIPSDTLGDMVNKQMQSPPFAKSVVGVISQNTSSVPTNGYSLLVYVYANIAWTNGVAIPTPITLTPFAKTNSVITWPLNLLSLQSSTNVDGPYVTIPGATSPYTNDMTTNAVNFFRLVY